MDDQARATLQMLRGRLQGFPVRLRNGMTVRKRNLDLMTLVLTNSVPADLMKASARLEDVYSEADGTAASIYAAIAKMEPAEREEMLLMLRTYACHAVSSPRFTMAQAPQGDDDVPVYVLEVPELLMIFNSEAPVGMPVEVPPTPPAMEEAERNTFPDLGAPVAAPPVADEQGVADPAVAHADSGLVEFNTY